MKPSFAELRIPLSERPIRKPIATSLISVDDVVAAGTFSETLEHLVFDRSSLKPLFEKALAASERHRCLLCEDAGFLKYCYGHSDRFLPIRNTDEIDEVYELEEDPFCPVPQEILEYYYAVRHRVCALFGLLRSEQLVAIGHTEKGDRVLLSHAIWSHPGYYVHPQLNEIYEAKPTRMVRRWLGVCFEKGKVGLPSETVQTEPFLATKIRTSTTTVTAFDACVSWLCDEMSRSPDARRGKKSDWMHTALEKWSGKLSKRAFLRAWDASISRTKAWSWGRPGAPRKRH